LSCYLLADRIKERLKNNITATGCNLRLKRGYTEDKLIADINLINEEKYD
jgi:hypothetical protein